MRTTNKGKRTMIISTEIAEQNPFYTDPNGSKSWTSLQGDKYHVTGTTTDGRRFKIVTESWKHASGVNLYRGSKWLVRGGRRWLITRAYN